MHRSNGREVAESAILESTARSLSLTFDKQTEESLSMLLDDMLEFAQEQTISHVYNKVRS